MAAFQLMLGLGLLMLGAEGLVRGASALARRLGVAPLVVGLTVVAFGTSAPELVVSVRATLDDRGAIAVGNVIGSNIANIGLILGLAALIRPLGVKAQIVRLDIPIMIGVSAGAGLLLLGGSLARPAGLLLVATLVAYTLLGIQIARREREPAVIAEFDRAVPTAPRRLLAEVVLIVAGLAFLVGGAELFVRGAVVVARQLGLSEAAIGLTVVAVGTSLPELATSIAASVKGESDIAVGNVVGSNIFNLLGILGAAALVRPLAFSGIDGVDLAVMLLAALLVLPAARSGMRLERWEGALLLAGYAAYVACLL